MESMVVLAWNVRGLLGSIRETLRFINDLEVDCLVVTETKANSTSIDRMELKNYNLVASFIREQCRGFLYNKMGGGVSIYTKNI